MQAVSAHLTSKQLGRIGRLRHHVDIPLCTLIDLSDGVSHIRRAAALLMARVVGLVHAAGHRMQMIAPMRLMAAPPLLMICNL